MIRVLADFHHHALWQSYVLLCRRFGWELYRPIGMDWFTEWYWNFEREWHGDRVARQYLEPWGSDETFPEWSERADHKNPGETFRMVTLEQFHDQTWDVVISSLPPNDRGFAKLAAGKGAKFVSQVGNQGQTISYELDPIILASASGVPIPGRGLIYHQEFSLDTFRYEPPVGFGPFASFVNCFPETPEYPRFVELAKGHPGLDCRVYGSYGSAPKDDLAEADIVATPDIADAMREAGAIYHAKYWSDGFGHVIHNAFAVGRPVIGSFRYYRDKLAAPLWVEGKTSYDIDRMSRDEIAATVRGLRADPDRYRAMCEAAAARFREVVDFDGEAEAIRGLLE